MLVFFLGCVAVSVRDFLPPDGPYTRVLAKLPRITMQDGAPPGMDCRADLLQSLDLEGGREGGRESAHNENDGFRKTNTPRGKILDSRSSCSRPSEADMFPILYDLRVAHVAGWEPCNPHDPGRVSSVGTCAIQILHDP